MGALLCAALLAADVQAAKIGIVGSGVAGSSAAFFLREALGPSADIVVWERDAVVGGRARSVALGDKHFDGGATAISSLNEYLMNATAGMQRRDDTGGDLGVFDGATFRFLSSERALPLAARVVARYGFAPARVLPALKQTVHNLSRVYDLQRADVAFDTPESLFRALGLYELTQVTAYDHFKSLGVPDEFVKEFVDGASRDNYNQDGGMNAFADMVSLAGAALAGEVFELAGGTVQIPEKYLADARADVRLGAEVVAIDGSAPPYVVVDAAGRRESVDAVIVATPLEFTSLSLPETAVAAAKRPYEPNYVAFAAGALNGTIFGDRAADLDAVLTVDGVDFSCIGAHGSEGGDRVYKVMSRSRLSDARVDELFEARASPIARVDWNATGAYPVLAPTPGAAWPPFVLGDGVYYANMEVPVSCMETEIIAGKNAALLAAARVAA